MASWAETKCPHCKKVVNIKNSKYVQRLITQLKTIKEQYAMAIKNSHNVHLSKNGEIQSLHKKIGLMLELMNEEQIKKFREINKPCREEVKRWEKRLFGL